MLCALVFVFFLCKQKTAYEMRISDWSSDVCSSDLILAGVDTDFQGEARAQPGTKIGYLAQEPDLNPEKTVREAVEEGVAVILDAQKRLEEVYAAYAEDGADFDKLAKEQEQLANLLAANDAHAQERQLEVAADALRLPPWDAIIGPLSGGE